MGDPHFAQLNLYSELAEVAADTLGGQGRTHVTTKYLQVSVEKHQPLEW